MNTEAVVERLRGARLEVEGVCWALRSPTAGAVDGCSARLEAVGAELAGASGWLRPARGHPDALDEARKLRTAAGLARRLIESASAFHEGWGRLLGSRTGGYRPGGAPAPFRHASRISLHG